MFGIGVLVRSISVFYTKKDLCSQTTLRQFCAGGDERRTNEWGSRRSFTVYSHSCQPPFPSDVVEVRIPKKKRERQQVRFSYYCALDDCCTSSLSDSRLPFFLSMASFLLFISITLKNLPSLKWPAYQYYVQKNPDWSHPFATGRKSVVFRQRLAGWLPAIWVITRRMDTLLARDRHATGHEYVHFGPVRSCSLQKRNQNARKPTCYMYQK